jgi:hypothetical protein
MKNYTNEKRFGGFSKFFAAILSMSMMLSATSFAMDQQGDVEQQGVVAKVGAAATSDACIKILKAVAIGAGVCCIAGGFFFGYGAGWGSCELTNMDDDDGGYDPVTGQPTNFTTQTCEFVADCFKNAAGL